MDDLFDILELSVFWQQQEKIDVKIFNTIFQKLDVNEQMKRGTSLCVINDTD